MPTNNLASMPSRRGLMLLAALAAFLVFHRTATAQIFVDVARGNDSAAGTMEKPLQSISAAIAKLPDPLAQSAEIRVLPGSYATTGGHAMATDRLELMRRMRPGVQVRIVGEKSAAGEIPIFAWEGGTVMVDVRDGDWWIENVQVGSGTTRQRRGVYVIGPATATLKDVTFRTRSFSDAGIYATRGGRIILLGAIKLNEHLHAAAPDESFAGIIAEYNGVVQFADGGNLSLDMGNGSLATGYYGIIELGCKTARITNWTEQSNGLGINNGGRIDLHNTETTICAKNRRNTPIGLEHDGHILAEDAHIIIEGENESAIALQKSSTLTCNDIELRGKFETALWASSGSMFVGRFIGDVPALSATTSATVNVEEIKNGGKITGEVRATRGGTVTLPDRTVSEEHFRTSPIGHNATEQ